LPPSLCLIAVDSNAGPISRDLPRLARDAGMDGILLSRAAQGEKLSATIGDASAPGLKVFADVDLASFPIGHPLVGQFPERFAIRRALSTEPVIDPRRPGPATGEARARLREPDLPEEIFEALCARVAELARAGLAGLRLTRAEDLPGSVVGRLKEETRRQHPDFRLIGGPVQRDPKVLAQLRLAKLDWLISSFAWWDRSAPWLVEEYDELSAIAPLIAELPSTRLGHAPDTVAAMLAAAAATASGFIAPAVALRSQQDWAAAGKAVEAARMAADYPGELRRLTGSGSAVTALLRSGEGELRSADRALLVLINRSTAEQSVPAVLHGGVGGAFGLGETACRAKGAATLLGPGEVRLIPIRRTHPVRTRPAGMAARVARTMPRLVLEEVTPSVAGGDFAVKRVVGELVQVSAAIYADGHEQLAAELCWRAADERLWSRCRMEQDVNDIWRCAFPLERLGRHHFMVEGWLDRFGGYRRDLRKKTDAGVAQPVDFDEGRLMVGQARERSSGPLAARLAELEKTLDAARGTEDAAEILLSEELAVLMARADERPHRVRSKAYPVDADRIEARFSSWYELFPRSITSDKARHGTFADVIEDLPRVQAMGFDTLYFPPIHPIGRTNRKGPNNTLTPAPGDPGSPYAIGSQEGGHDAIHPELGSLKDFDRLVRAARDHGLEIALDFAIQASPDHPWLKEHPGWFAWRPDGSIKYAENPPKKYQDIVNVDFYGPDAAPGLWEALRDVVLFWAERGVKTFRVDNPHTKPLPFWEWMIADIRDKHPEVIFLSEAFTRPTMMYRLAKIGFTQSYTYFTWRDRKQELIDYITELTTTEPREFYRPNFFVNTPDINPFFLQTSGRPGFRIRAVLAATLSGLWGIYSGFELCENEPLGPGREEYLDSEKYEIRPRPPRMPGDIVDDVTLLNRLRRAYPALQTHLNTRFYLAYDEHIIWYGKPAPDGSEMIMVMVNLDPHTPHECDFEVPLWEFALPDNAGVAVEDLAAGHRFEWHGKVQHIRLTPEEPYRIWRIAPPGGAA